MTSNFDTGLDGQERFVREVGEYTVDEQLRKTARMHSDRVAVAAPGTDTAYTYRELDRRSDRLADALRGDGHVPNESAVAVLAENRVELVTVAHACAKLGCLFTALNWRLEREELVHCVDLLDPDAVFVSGRFEEKRQWFDADADAEPAYVALDHEAGGREYDGFLDAGSAGDPFPDGRVDPEQGFAVIYTSGTTGLPKGVVISHRAELARAAQVTIDYGLEHGDNYPAWGPMFHQAGVDWIVVEAVLGGTYYPIDGFDRDAIVAALRTSPRPISWLFSVPGMVDRLVDAAAPAADEFAAIRTIGALPDLIPPEKIARATELFDAPFQNTYGSTETGHVASGSKIPVGVAPSDSVLRKEESPFIDVKLIDEEWNEVADRGELAVRGPSVCSGYVNNADANRENFNDGWFRTGDVFVRDGEAAYQFVNRRKYLIKSGGENIYPAELEQVILEHADVEDAVVVRAMDPDWGEVPRAVVGTRAPSDELREELLASLRERLAGYKQPRYFEFVDPAEFPRSTTGKIVREDVEAWERAAAARVEDR